ncbi:hypothetical protein MMMDOFMJ_1823 [Methylobacterium gnaphalii]|nr:hypothetical protein [Methylobacterium gnaphalii]GJD68898.1 hypothetical protein MMMDOFMJ_1823 [Methylobacterium gnaphalii]
MTRTSLFAALLICGASPALAQSADARAACEPDVWRLCASHIPSASAITACLRSQRTNLSPACRTVMDGGHANPNRRRSAEAR